jgi:hypothetical protein
MAMIAPLHQKLLCIIYSIWPGWRCDSNSNSNTDTIATAATTTTFYH